jgi:hypothetical protein
VDGFERVVKVFGSPPGTQEFVAVRVLDEQVSVRDIVSKFSDVVKRRTCFSF